MAKQKNAKGSGSKKFGRNEAKCKRYASMHKREMHKVKRVLQSSGLAAAEQYARKYGVETYLRSLAGHPI